jgi:potassium efflux system protein
MKCKKMYRPGCKHQHLVLILIVVILQALFAPAFSQVKRRLLQGRHSKTSDSLVVKADTSVPVLINKIENYSYTIDHTNFLFRNPLNVSPIYLDLNDMEKRLDGFKSRLEQRGSKMNLRSINSSIILLKEIAYKLSGYKAVLSKYNTQLSQSNAQVKKIITDPTLKLQVSDSVLADQLSDLLTEGKNLDSVQAQILGRINLLLNHVSITLLQASDIISDMGYLSISKKMSMWETEEAPLFEAHPEHYTHTFVQVFTMSIERSAMIIAVYLSGKSTLLFWSCLAFVFTLAWMYSVIFRLKKSETATAVFMPVHFLNRSIVIAAVFGYLVYVPFFFANPPMSLLHFVEILRLLLLVYLLKPFVSKHVRVTALVTGIVWIVLATDDILLESAFGERWELFLFALLLVVICIRLLRESKPFFLSIGESPATKPVLFVSLSFAVLSVVFNVTGRLSLAKIAGITAIQAILVGLALKVFFTLVVEAVYLQFKSFSRIRFSNIMDFAGIYAKMGKGIWTMAILVWTVSIIRNLTFYDETVKAVNEFINIQRKIGSMVFTFRSIAVFILILWISVAFSTAVNFFFGSESTTDMKKKGKLGSLMLLIRLAIWILGFLIGVSAAGIPLDKLSLMIGALGVGIGFGLQNIVNNLVSGVILAFERPIQVGDSIEVGTRSGIVQEIGVRSSKIKNAEGADIIIPNGDLLSQQLVNWTMQDNSRRVDFVLTFPFPSDIEKIKSLLQEQLLKNEHVLKSPAPAVNIQAFQPTAVEIKVMWWIPDLTKAGSARSELMQQVYESLNAAGVAFEK